MEQNETATSAAHNHVKLSTQSDEKLQETRKIAERNKTRLAASAAPTLVGAAGLVRTVHTLDDGRSEEECCP